MKKIRVTTKQLNMIAENFRPKQVIKLSNSQMTMLKESINQDTDKKPINVVEFGTSIVKAINEMFSGDGKVEMPKILLELGVDESSFKQKVLSDRIINVGEDDNGEPTFEFKSRGFFKWCQNYMDELVNKDKPSGFINKEVEISEEVEGFKDSDNTYDWKELALDFEYKPNDTVRLISKDTGIDDIYVLSIEGEVVIFHNEYKIDLNTSDIEQFIYNMINGYILKDVENAHLWENYSVKEFMTANSDYLVVRPQTVKDTIEGFVVAFGEVGKLPQIFESIFTSDEEILEMTSTGAIGGGFDSPMAWSNGEETAVKKDPAVKGGTIIKNKINTASFLE